MAFVRRVLVRCGRFCAAFTWWFIGVWSALAIYFTGPGPKLATGLLAAAVLALFWFARKEPLRIWRWFQTAWLDKRWTTFALVAATAVAIYYFGFVTPNTDVEWAPEQARHPVVEIDGDKVRVDGEDVVARIADLPGTPIVLLSVGESVYRVAASRGPSKGRYSLAADGRRYEVEALDERTRAIRQLSAATAGPSGPAPLVAPMPGLIVRINVAQGDQVKAGQGLVVMEAMKMENELRAVAAGTVKAIRVSPGTAVERGATLVELE